MSLIKCDECGNMISDRSLFCPHCGFPTHLNAAHPTGKAPEEFKKLETAINAPKSEPSEYSKNSENSEIEAVDFEERHRRNERAKIWMFIGVFIALLAIVIYFFITAPTDAESADDDDFAVESVPEMSDTTATDTISEAVDSVAAISAVPAAAARVRPVVRQAREQSPGAEEPREVTVKSLREQTSETPPAAAQPAPEPAAE